MCSEWRESREEKKKEKKREKKKVKEENSLVVGEIIKKSKRS